jgi:hypothetical protein
MEKIKINLTSKALEDLTNDMISFEYYKKDGQINKNGFLNTLLKNYFSIYDTQATEEIEKYTNIIKKHIFQENKANEIINELIISNSFFAFTKQDSLNASISFKLINSNYNIFKIIENKYLKYQSISSFFRNMIDTYLSLPKYKREQIIYLNTYELLIDAIKDKRKIKVFMKADEEREVMPYSVSTSKEELYNYLISMTDNKEKKRYVSSIRLARIESIYLLKEKYTFSSEDTEKVDCVIKNGAQFPYTNPCLAQIKLTSVGQKLYKKKYLNRPTPTKIEDDIYHFNCSYDQLVLYFFSFGKEAKILSPDYLTNNLKEKYLQAYNNYNLEEIKN